jgi:hypothetical protein
MLCASFIIGTFCSFWISSSRNIATSMTRSRRVEEEHRRLDGVRKTDFTLFEIKTLGRPNSGKEDRTITPPRSFDSKNGISYLSASVASPANKVMFKRRNTKICYRMVLEWILANLIRFQSPHRTIPRRYRAVRSLVHLVGRSFDA